MRTHDKKSNFLHLKFHQKIQTLVLYFLIKEILIQNYFIRTKFSPRI
jgi:hypothetical protein